MGIHAQQWGVVGLSRWPDTRILALTGASLPIIQAPMAGSSGVDLAVAAISAGAVGSLPCALLSPEQVEAQTGEVRSRATGPLNLNFFCHALDDAPDDSEWRRRLAPYYEEAGIDPASSAGAPPRVPFNAAMAATVERTRPEIVSFHFGLPPEDLFRRVRDTGAIIISSATTAAEARWLADRGTDAIIAQGFEAGGHAGHFLAGHRPMGLFALVRTILSSVDVPVIAAGGIVDGAGIAAAFMLGASAVQIGTAYLATPESLIGPAHRARLGTQSGETTVITNLLTGREARGMRNRLIDEMGPMCENAPAFPHAATALASLRAQAEAQGRDDFSSLWAGQAASLVRETGAKQLTEQLARDALALLEGRR